MAGRAFDGVDAAPIDQAVIALKNIKVVADAAGEGVRATAADQGIVAGAAAQPVVAGAAAEPIGGGVADQGVMAAAGDGVFDLGAVGDGDVMGRRL